MALPFQITLNLTKHQTFSARMDRILESPMHYRNSLLKEFEDDINCTFMTVRVVSDKNKHGRTRLIVNRVLGALRVYHPEYNHTVWYKNIAGINPLEVATDAMIEDEDYLNPGNYEMIKGVKTPIDQERHSAFLNGVAK